MPTIDERIATEVMGWEIYKWLHNGCTHSAWRTAPHGDLERLPAFSSDIAAAWRVVERMADFGWIVSIMRGQQRVLVSFQRD